MFGSLGAPEIIFILLLALLVFGPRRLPEMGRTIGRALGEFRRATTDLKRSINTEIALEDAEERPTYQRTPVRRSPETPADGGERESAPVPTAAAGAEPRGGGAEPGGDDGESAGPEERPDRGSDGAEVEAAARS